jgi:predicted RNase H-like HicB family nuclease
VTYTAIIEETDHNYAAYIPDLPGCIATGATIAEVEANLHEALAWHIEALREEHLEIPGPKSRVALVQV